MLNDPDLDELDGPDDADPIVDQAPAAAGEVAEAGSILAGLRAQYAEASLDETEIFEITSAPGLWIRCRFVPTARLDAAGKSLARVRDKGAQMTYGSIETIRACIVEVLVSGPGGIKRPLGWVLDPDAVHEPIALDEQLCDVLGFDHALLKSPRKLVRALFKGNDHAIRTMAIEVSEWMDTVGSGVRGDFLGK